MFIASDSDHIPVRILSALLLIAVTFAGSEVKGLGKDTLDQTARTLSLRGKVVSVKVIPNAPKSRYAANLLEIELNLELINTSTTPIIFLDREPRFVGVALAKQPNDLQNGNYLARTYVGPAVSLAPEWAALRQRLDKRAPPPDQTRILMPNESWSLVATVGVSLPDHPETSALAKNASWKDIKELSTVWLRVVCEVWPWNLELGADRSKLTFGRKLQRQWKDVGSLWLDEIYSEPMALRLSGGIEEGFNARVLIPQTLMKQIRRP